MSKFMENGNIAKLLVVAVVGFFAPCVAQAANTMSINYYTISSSNPDANHLAFGTFNNEVQNALGPNGLPVLNTAAYGCTANCFSANGAPGSPLGGTPNNINVVSGGPGAGEITYWSPALNPYVTLTGTGVVTLPFGVSQNFFPPNGGGTSNGGSNGFQAAALTGNLIVPAATSETISFNIGADDMAFAYLDGKIVCDLGGVHAATAGTCTSATIGAGSHLLDVFFVDINQVQSGLTFGINTSNIITTPVSPVPEPGTYAMLFVGLGLIGFAARRKDVQTE